MVKQRNQLDKSSLRRVAYRLVLWQFIVVMGLALVLFLLRGIQGGVSALVGGFTYCVPNLAFVWRVFARVNAEVARSIVIAFFAGELAKLFLSAILFVLAIKFLPLTPLYTLIGYAGAIVAFWFICAVYLTRHPGVSL